MLKKLNHNIQEISYTPHPPNEFQTAHAVSCHPLFQADCLISFYRQIILCFGLGMSLFACFSGWIVTGGWFVWSLMVRRQRPYFWKIVVFLICLNLLLLLEVGDFPPVFWTFDAHSLWHAGTAPIVLLWYRCVF